MISSTKPISIRCPNNRLRQKRPFHRQKRDLPPTICTLVYNKMYTICTLQNEKEVFGSIYLCDKGNETLNHTDMKTIRFFGMLWLAATISLSFCAFSWCDCVSYATSHSGIWGIIFLLMHARFQDSCI